MSQNLDLNLQITNFCSTLPTDKLKNAILENETIKFECVIICSLSSSSQNLRTWGAF